MITARFDFPVLADTDAPALLHAARRARGVLAATIVGTTLEMLVASAGHVEEAKGAILDTFDDAPACPV